MEIYALCAKVPTPMHVAEVKICFAFVRHVSPSEARLPGFLNSSIEAERLVIVTEYLNPNAEP